MDGTVVGVVEQEEAGGGKGESPGLLQLQRRPGRLFRSNSLYQETEQRGVDQMKPDVDQMVGSRFPGE